MTERFIYPPSADHAARVSIGEGASLAEFTGAALGGKDWASAVLWIFPDDAAPYLAGVIADLSPNEDTYSDLELPLARDWEGDAIVSAKFMLVPSIAQVQGANVAAMVSRFLSAFQQNRGVTGNKIDLAELALLPNGSWTYDGDTRQILEYRNGVETPLDLSPIFLSRGPWEGPAGRTELAIDAGNVVIDYSAGLIIEGVSYFALTVDDDCNIAAITNVPLGGVVDILWLYSGTGHTITFATLYNLTSEFIRSTNGAQTRTQHIVSAISGSTATSIQSTLFEYQRNDLVQYGEFNFGSNRDGNTFEPVVDNLGNPVSDLNWTFIRLTGPEGPAGSALVTATSSSSVSIGSGDKTFTITEEQERGFALGAVLRVASAANPVTFYMRGTVTAYDHPEITISVPSDGFAGSGSRDDWRMSVSGFRGADGKLPGVIFAWDVGTSDMNPGAGEIRANNADLSAASFLYVNKSNRDGSPVGNWLLGLGSSDSARKGTIFLTNAIGRTVVAELVSAADATSYVRLGIVWEDGETSFSESDAISFEFRRTGDKGDAGGTAAGTTYDNTDSGLAATDVQEAIDELAGGLETSLTAAGTSYDNSVSELDADDVQEAIDEIVVLLSGPSGAIIAPQGRLTLESGVPVSTSAQSAKTAVYYTPYEGAYCPIFDGGDWLNYEFTEQTLNLSSDSGHTGYHQSGKNFDVFFAWVSGTVYLGTGPAWTSDSARGTGAGTTELEVFEGRRVNKESMTLRHGSASGNTVTVPARQGTYLGTIRCNANGQTEDHGGGAVTIARRYVWNAYNRVRRPMSSWETTSSWSYTTSTVRRMNANTNLELRFVVGAAEDAFLAQSLHPMTSSATPAAGVGYDSATAFHSDALFGFGAANSAFGTVASSLMLIPAIGYHYLAPLELGNTGATFYGSLTGGFSRAGIIADVWG